MRTSVHVFPCKSRHPFIGEGEEGEGSQADRRGAAKAARVGGTTPEGGGDATPEGNGKGTVHYSPIQFLWRERGREGGRDIEREGGSEREGGKGESGEERQGGG